MRKLFSKSSLQFFQPKNLINRLYSSVVDPKCFYTKDHEWIRVEGNVGVIGITDHAQDLLGDITSVSYNVKVGQKITKKFHIGGVESVKTFSG